MRAFLSDREQRADITTSDAMTRPTTGIGQFCQEMHPGAGFQAEDIWHMAAIREARAILAETEPQSHCPDAITATYGLSSLAASVHHRGIAFTLPHDIQAALAEALAAFLED